MRYKTREGSSVRSRSNAWDPLDGYDGTVHDGPFQLSRNRPIEDERPG